MPAVPAPDDRICKTGSLSGVLTRKGDGAQPRIAAVKPLREPLEKLL